MARLELELTTGDKELLDELIDETPQEDDAVLPGLEFFNSRDWYSRTFTYWYIIPDDPYSFGIRDAEKLNKYCTGEIGVALTATLTDFKDHTTPPDLIDRHAIYKNVLTWSITQYELKQGRDFTILRDDGDDIYVRWLRDPVVLESQKIDDEDLPTLF